MQNLLEIAELRWLIVRHLAGKDLKACALVCKAWHQYFQQLIWRVLRWSPATDREHTTDWQEAVKKNAQWIKCIERGTCTRMVLSVENHLLTHCRSLLSIETPRGANRNIWISLIKLNPGLQRLDALGLDIEGRSQLEFALRGHGQLYYLRLVYTDLPTLLGILTSCPTLRELNVGYMRKQLQGRGGKQAHKEEGRATSRQTFGIRHLAIASDSDQAMVEELVLHLPNIESLEAAPKFQSSCIDMAKLFRDGLFPRVTKLTLKSFDDHSELMEAIPSGQVSSFTMYLHNTRMIRSMLDRHGPSLEVLHVPCCTRSTLIPEFLFQCPRLKKIELPNDDSFDIHYDIDDLLRRPWVCKDIEVLKIPIHAYRGDKAQVSPEVEKALVANQARDDPEPEHQVAEDLFLDRVSKLGKLREVNVVMRIPRPLSDETLAALKAMTLRRGTF